MRHKNKKIIALFLGLFMAAVLCFGQESADFIGFWVEPRYFTDQLGQFFIFNEENKFALGHFESEMTDGDYSVSNGHLILSYMPIYYDEEPDGPTIIDFAYRFSDENTVELTDERGRKYTYQKTDIDSYIPWRSLSSLGGVKIPGREGMAAEESQTVIPESKEVVESEETEEPEEIQTVIDEDALMQQGIDLAMQRDWLGAIVAFTEIVEYNNKNAQAYLNLGKAYLAYMVDPQDVAEGFSDFSFGSGVIADDDDGESETMNVSSVFYALYFAVNLEPENDTAHYWLGEFYRALGWWELARDSYTEAIAINPNKSVYYQVRGKVNRYNGDLDEALADSEQAIALNPDDTVAYNDRAFTYAEKGEYGKAYEDFNYLLSFYPDSVDTYINRGMSLYGMGQYDKAIPDFTQGIEAYPDDAYLYYYRGDCYASVGDTEKAEADFAKAESLGMEFE
jgi:tetratricopeptide (TPR) repeat protein